MISSPKKLGHELFRNYHRRTGKYTIARDRLDPELIQWLTDNASLVWVDSPRNNCKFCTGCVKLGRFTAYFSRTIFDPSEWPDLFAYGFDADALIAEE